MNTINFYSQNEEYGCFSNFSPHPVYIDNVCYSTTEHYFQSQKFTDEKYRLKIIKAETPSKAATLGRSRSIPLRKDWERIKDGIMLLAVRTKVEQHKDVYDTLMSTGNAVLVEHTKNDSYWGDGGDGSGRNQLGKTLMKVREELKIQK